MRVVSTSKFGDAGARPHPTAAFATPLGRSVEYGYENTESDFAELMGSGFVAHGAEALDMARRHHFDWGQENLCLVNLLVAAMVRLGMHTFLAHRLVGLPMLFLAVPAAVESG